MMNDEDKTKSQFPIDNYDLTINRRVQHDKG